MNSMKITWMTRLILVVSLLAVGGVVWADSGTNEPGSAEDPLVTKSYVDQLVQKKLAELGASVPKPAPVPSTPVPNPELQPPATGTKTESLKAGDRIIGFAGTEFIVRTGNVTAIASVNGDGLPNVTAGVDIAGGKAVAKNHLIMIPRADGRGLLVAANSPESWVIINGPYEIVRKP
jgi:hypothetical protein